jgi:uncharacterized protein (TIGR00369 family)
VTRATEQLDAMVARTYVRSPSAEALDLPLIDGWSPGRVWGDWTVDARFANGRGVLFGGYLSAVLDDIGVSASDTLVGDHETGVTQDLRVTYFRPAKVGEPLRLEAEVINASARTHHVEAKATRADGKLVAAATVVVALVAAS